MTQQTLQLSQILVEDRLRRDLGDIDGLADDIVEHGLIQPLVLVLSDGQHKLVAGGRRYTALKQLGHATVHHGITCDPSRPGFVYASELSPELQREIELMENIQRKEMTWQEEVRACVEIHRLYKRRAALAGQRWILPDTAARIGYDQSYVSYCLDLIDDLDSPAFADCLGITDAIKKRAEQRMNDAVKEQMRRSQVNLPTLGVQTTLTNPMPCVSCEGTGKYYKTGEPCRSCAGTGKVEHYDKTETKWETGQPQELVVNLSNTLFLGDSIRTILPQWPAACVDHIITDPPYGIDMSNLQQSSGMIDVSAVVATHDVSDNLAMFPDMFKQFYRVLKDTGYCIVCCDIMNWHTLYDLAISVGFRVQRWPIVWRKTYPCKNEAANVNFTKDHELAMVCRKSAATLPNTVQRCVVDAGRAEFVSNPFAKPHDFWKFCIEAVSLPEQTVLDPFAGEGSSTMSCLALQRKPIAVELDDMHFAHLVTKYKKFYTDRLRNVKFV